MYRNKKILKAVRDFDCQLCGKYGRGETVPAHANWSQYGKGMGVKAHDCYVAAVCNDCHNLIDGRRGCLSDTDKHEAWRRAWIKTILLLFQHGIVK